MQIYGRLSAICFLWASDWRSATAFLVKAPRRATSGSPASVLGANKSPETPGIDMFPPGTYTRWETVQGGGTIKTFQMPDHAERCQYMFKTNGRPLKATVELWVGPLRKVHNLALDIEDGQTCPYEATIKFKKLSPNLRVSASDTLEFPMQVGVSVPSPQRSKELGENTQNVWDNCTPDQKQLIQGGSTQGGGGSVRTWDIPTHVDSVQIISWSGDVGKKSFRQAIEVLQGPNCIKQKINLQCGGGSQPYHGVIQTPGPGWMVRIVNKKFIEDGLYQFAVVPYAVSGSAAEPPSYVQPNQFGGLM